jgi:hypothetical protein
MENMMILRGLVDEAWQLYIKILDSERTSTFLHVGIFNRGADKQYRLTNKAYCRYKRRRIALDSADSALMAIFPNQQLQSLTR